MVGDGSIVNPFTATMSLENDNNAKFEIFAPSFVIALPSEKLSVRTILKVDLFDIRPENTLFAGVCVDFSSQKLHELGQWKG